MHSPCIIRVFALLQVFMILENKMYFEKFLGLKLELNQSVDKELALGSSL